MPQTFERGGESLTDWKRLERDLGSWLEGFVRPGLIYRNSYQAIPGFDTDGFRSDGCLTDGKALLAIEVEAAQMHPDTNVGKYWLLHTKHRYEHIVLLHVFTPDYDSYGSRLELARFVAAKMRAEVPLEYEFLDHREAADYERTAAELRSQIGKRIRELFGTE